MNKTLKMNIINFLNWNDRYANIDGSYSGHELLAMFVYIMNYNTLDCYNWIDLMEYSKDELFESLTEETLVILNETNATEKEFKKLLDMIN